MKYVFGTVGLALFMWVAYIGFDRQEIAECKTWQTEAKQYKSYYLLQWQADQCFAHDIEIDAKVVKIYKDIINASTTGEE